jgi:hypothetical protein
MILIRDFWTEPGGDREISCLALVVEFDSDKIKPGGLFEAIQISITLVIDAHERAAITDSSPAHIQERLRLLCRELCPLFGSLLIAQSLEQEVTPARLKPNQLRPFRRRSQIAFNNIRCRKARSFKIIRTIDGATLKRRSIFIFLTSPAGPHAWAVTWRN